MTDYDVNLLAARLAQLIPRVERAAREAAETDQQTGLALGIVDLRDAVSVLRVQAAQLTAIDRIVPKRPESPDAPLVERVTQAVVQMQHDDQRVETWRTETEQLRAQLTALTREREVLAKAVGALGIAWSVSWDCSRDPGHKQMRDAWDFVEKLLAPAPASTED